MNTWDQLNEWLATVIVASLTWAYSVVSPVPPPSADSGVAQRGLMVGWAQQVDQPPIEQVGEGTNDDLETLDEGATPPVDIQLTDQETLDAGTAPVAQDDDVELLDQGAPPAVVVQPVETVYVAPVAEVSTTYVAPEPVVAAGPVLPEGFGTGRVHAVAGRSGIPPGLDDCHVGAVTGRAYVGLDCGEDVERTFVGHAPSFEEFPFVVEADFPFEGDEAFFTDENFPFGDDDDDFFAAADDDGDDTDVVVSAGGDARDRQDDETTDPVVETSGESSVQFAQRASDRDPRVRVDDRRSKRSKDADKDRQRNGDAAADEDRASANSRERKKRGNDDGVNADSKEKKTKDKKNKRRADRKEEKDRQREER